MGGQIDLNFPILFNFFVSKAGTVNEVDLASTPACSSLNTACIHPTLSSRLAGVCAYRLMPSIAEYGTRLIFAR